MGYPFSPSLTPSSRTFRRIQILAVQEKPACNFSNCSHHHLRSIVFFPSVPCSAHLECWGLRLARCAAYIANHAPNQTTQWLCGRHKLSVYKLVLVCQRCGRNSPPMPSAHFLFFVSTAVSLALSWRDSSTNRQQLTHMLHFRAVTERHRLFFRPQLHTLLCSYTVYKAGK